MGIHNSSSLVTERRVEKLNMKIFMTVASLLALASAEAEPSYGYGGIAHHPYGGSSYRGRTVYGYGSHVSHGYGYGHGHARSYVYRQQYDGPSHGYGYHGLHKRDAEAEPSYGYTGIAHHGYGATAYRGRTVYGYPSRGYGYGYHGLHKRDAEAEPSYGYTGIAHH